MKENRSLSLTEMSKPVAQHLRDFEPYFTRQLQSPHRMLTLVTNQVFRRKGKQMRPLLVFLSAAAVGQVSEATFAAATLIELLHNASLVHDDVVDEAYTRRGQWSVMGLWDSKTAVLVGDFFLARGMEVALDGGHVDVLKIVSHAVGELAKGELSQMEHAHKLDITEDDYYEVIRQKTATLIQACTHAGAVSAGATPEQCKALAEYGNALGIAFQIRDDIFDYAPTGLIGKPALNDIREQKMTLPLIHALSLAPELEKREFLRQVRLHPKTDDTAAAALLMVEAHGGLDYAQQQVARFADKAKQAIASLPDSPAKQSLIDLVDFNTSRLK